MDWKWLISLLFGSGVLLSIGGHYINKIKADIKANEEKTKAVCLGVQALLRDRLLTAYNKYSEEGYAPIYAKENFENMWKQYHNLGVNGVMDDIHVRFMELPDREVEE